MRIIVASKKDMRSQYYLDKTWFFDKTKFFITISGLADDMDYAYPLKGPHILRLAFDDITEYYYNEVKAAKDLMLFNEDEAKKIHKFVDSLPKDCSLYVNCAAGISRSGAVGFCINEYVNNDNPEDFDYFEKTNTQIQPNPYVKRILTKELFGEPNWNEIFKA